MRLARLSRALSLRKKYLFCVILLAWVVFFTIFSILTVELQEKDKNSFLGIFSKISTNGDEYWDFTNQGGVRTSRIKGMQLRVEHRVLLVHKYTSDHGHSKLYSILTRLLEGFRITYTSSRLDETPVSSLKHFLDNNVHTGKYSVIVFLDLKSYVSLKPSLAKVVKDYTLKFRSGLLIFTNSYYGTVPELHIDVSKPLKDKHYYLSLNSSSPILKVTRDGGNIVVKLNGRSSQGTKWSIIEPYVSTTQYETVQSILLLNKFDKKSKATPIVGGKTSTTIAVDRGLVDGTKKVLFGGGFPFFIHSMLFIDCLHFLSPVEIIHTLDRYIQVDIDDIFIGKKGMRLKEEDVLELIETQDLISKKIPGFKFNLGFSGKGFQQGTPEESEGDQTLMAHAHKFNWFGHMFDHEQAHKFNTLKRLTDNMKRNMLFAKSKNLPLNTSYAVASHHSGVYPVHEPLYEAWKQVADVHVTSTEEYPHLRPAWLRRGFIYNGIKVLPRQTCDLYTTTNFFSDLPNGKKYLDKTIEGGELFQTVLRNPISIFMTHMTNYANDRLAPYVFTKLVKFLSRWTNLNLRFAQPMALADYYFRIFPEDKMPVWQNPCDDHRHLDIWSSMKSCSRLPSFLVIGPAYAGLSKLHRLLEMHPNLLHTKKKNETIEEVQFFDSDNYLKGLDWYMQFFPAPSDITEMSYEVSSSYFQTAKASYRASALLKSAKILIVLQDPTKRAYSHFMAWREKGIITNDASLEDVLEGKNQFHSLRESLLEPGHYSEHIGLWMKYFNHKQLLIVNEDDIVSKPSVVMEKVQEFLNIENPLDYKRYLRYEEENELFCPLNAMKMSECFGYTEKCYQPITKKEKEILDNYYSAHNKILLQINQKIQFALPKWLQDYSG